MKKIRQTQGDFLTQTVSS